MNNIITLYESQNSCTPKKSSGRPSKIGEETGQKMIEEVKMDPEITAEDLYRDKQINHNNASSRTIRRFLDDHDMVARRMM